MMKEPLISVGMPVYNRPVELKKALSSIAGQTYKNLEIIVSDNCSPNLEVIKIVEAFQKNDKRIRLYQQEKNIGASANFEFVLNRASGQYFMWAADDDFFESDNLITELVKYADTHILSFSDFTLSGNINNTSIYNSYNKCITKNDYLFAWLGHGGGHPIYGMYNLKIMEDEGLRLEFDDDLSYFNEGTMLHKLFLTGKVKFVSGVKIYYNQNSKKPNKFELCSSFLEYAYRSLKLFNNAELENVEKIKALTLIKKKYYKYLSSLFVSLRSKERKHIHLKILDQSFPFITKKQLLIMHIRWLLKYPKKKITRRLKRQFIKRYLFNQEFKVFKVTDGERFTVKAKDKYPRLNDRGKTTGFEKHYVYHTAWAARKLKQIMPKEHIDISSFTYFSTLVSAFIPTKFYEYNPAEIDLENLTHEHADITNLPFNDNSIQSLSSMHVVEHIGLGRYGDSLDVNGDLKAIAELKRVVAVDGNLLFIVPIGGVAKIMFNAHRIYSYEQVISYFKNFKLVEFSLIPDQCDKGIIINATKKQSDLQNYGCGCFLFKKM